MTKTNVMRVNAKDIDKRNGANDKDRFLQINLADDYSEVRGFGRPISAALAKKMAENYFSDCDNALALIDKIDEDKTGAYSTLKGQEFDSLKKMLDPDKHVVSGVFGKELILQILAQKGCEGIRYIIGSDDDKTTVIILGVEEITGEFTKDNDGNTIAKSQPVGQNNKFKYSAVKADTELSPSDPLNGEVHGSSKTISQLRSEGLSGGNQVARAVAPRPGSITDTLFGAY